MIGSDSRNVVPLNKAVSSRPILKANNQTDFIPLNMVPSRSTSVLNSRADNTIEYIPSNRLIPALESRNDFVRTSRTMSFLESRTNNLNKFSPLNKFSKLIISESRTSSPLDYTNRTSRPARLTLLGSKDNIMNIMCNTSICHSDTINEVIPSPFNEMTIY